ncbi:MAG: DUF418 domain-containing protein [Planctomycetota bacterium]|jgi:uncharacterized protein
MSVGDTPQRDSETAEAQAPGINEASAGSHDVSPAVAQLAPAAPVAGGERIDSIDVLRGFALCGVLLMNMQAYAMPFCAYMNPTSYKNEGTLNFVLWSVNHLLADAKFITIFSALFGAGILLMTSRATERTGRSAGVHYRRMLWMVLFGCLHGALLWYGDILLIYAICGMVAFLFRRRGVLLLVIVGFVLLCIPALLMVGFSTYMETMQAAELKQMMTMWAPSAETIQAKEAAYRGGYFDHLPVRFKSWSEMFGFLYIFGWRLLGVMLLGMALLKTDVLSAARSKAFYTAAIVIGFGCGLPLTAYGIQYQSASGWDMAQCMGMGMQFNYAGSLFSACAWIGVVMLACQSDGLRGLKRRFGAVGRMAFTNYIMHSVLCTTLFYGHGFGLFGRVDRLGQLLIVLGVAVLQLWYSPLWLSRYRFGPLEWVWRSLTYWRRQPMRRCVGAVSVARVQPTR